MGFPTRHRDGLIQPEKRGNAYETCTTPRYYFDIEQYEDFLQIGQPPFTPCETAMFTLGRRSAIDGR